MSLDWRRIEEATTEEAGLWRLVDELHHNEVAGSDLRRIEQILRYGKLPEAVRRCLRDALRKGNVDTQRIDPLWSGSSSDISTTEDVLGDGEVQVRLHPSGEITADAPQDTSETAVAPPESYPLPLDDAETAERAPLSERLAARERAPESALISRPTPDLIDLIPAGPHRIRFGGAIYESLHCEDVLELVRRGLFLGSDVDHEGEWVQASEHPAFAELVLAMRAEVDRLFGEVQGEAVYADATHPSIRPEDVFESGDITRPLDIPELDLSEESDLIVGEVGEEASHPFAQDNSVELSPAVRRALTSLRAIEDERAEDTTENVSGEDSTEETTTHFDLRGSESTNVVGASARKPAEPSVIIEEQDDDDVTTAVLEKVSRDRRSSARDENEFEEATQNMRPSTLLPDDEDYEDDDVTGVRDTREDSVVVAPTQVEARDIELAPAEVRNSNALPSLPPAPPSPRKRRYETTQRSVEPSVELRHAATQPLLVVPPQLSEPPRVITPRRRSVAMMVASCGILSVLAGVTILLVLATQGRLDTPGEPGPSVRPTVAISTASNAIRLAADPRLDDARYQEELADTLIRAGKFEGAVAILEGIRADARTPGTRLRGKLALTRLQAADFAGAREASYGAWVEGADRVKMLGIFAEATRLDPSLKAQPEIVSSEFATRAMPFERGTVKGYRLSKGDKTYEFLPARRRDDDIWRKQIAASRLGAVLGSSFELAPARPVMVRRDDLLAWSGGKLDSDLEFEKDATGTQFVSGAVIERDSGETRWPVELDEVWASWVSPEAPVSTRPLGHDLLPWDYVNVDFRPEFIEAVKGQATRESLGRQLSSLMVFDFLTSNYRRWNRKPVAFGETLGFKGPALVSRSEDGVFPTRVSKRVQLRAEVVEKFNPRELFALSAIRPVVFDDVLFSEPSAADARRLEAFWSQRDALLVRVEQLRTEHGAAVYFER